MKKTLLTMLILSVFTMGSLLSANTVSADDADKNPKKLELKERKANRLERKANRLEHAKDRKERKANRKERKAKRLNK